MAWLGFIELDKAVILVWLDWLVSREYGFSVSALCCPLATPTFLLAFLLPWAGLSLHSCSSKVQPLLLTLDEGYLLTASLPDFQRGIARLGPPAPVQLLLLGHGVAPPGRRPWPLNETKPCPWGNPNGWVMVERSDRMWSTGEGNGKPLQYSCLENHMNSMKRKNDRMLKEELPRSVGAQYATGDKWRNNSRKKEGMEQKQKETQLWVWLVIEARSDAVKSNTE